MVVSIHRPIRVFLLDDHEVVRRGVRSLLETAGGFEVVGEAGSAREGLRGIVDARPDVALVDMRIPGGDGVQLVREVRSQVPETACLILTSFAEEEAFFQAAISGASGFLVKDGATQDLVEGLRTVAAGGTLIDPARLDQLRERAREVPDVELLADLTSQERRVLALIAEGRTNREIATELFLAEKTVRNYVSNILSKLDLKNRTQAATHVARLVNRPRPTR